ncbi:hypothetical protein F652_2439 [Enterobacteriaceae bacterium bta3-1]|nr:hypothetical protein F652_2439 [Enterobacteriaceae bacterium bta3-1]
MVYEVGTVHALYNAVAHSLFYVSDRNSESGYISHRMTPK